jgi:hypothetical protein
LTINVSSIRACDVPALYVALLSIGRVERVILFVRSDGGAGTASLRMVHVLRQYARHVVAAVPLNCASAATMLALGADEIHMGPLAFLTAIDTSLRHELAPRSATNEDVSVSHDEMTRAVALYESKEKRGSRASAWDAVFEHVHPLVVGAVDRASSLSIKLCEEILGYHLGDARKAARISRHLNGAYPSHSYPITLREAERIGLHVRELDPKVNELLMQLAQAYAEIGQKADTYENEFRYHSDEVRKIVECRGLQLSYRMEKDWHYVKEERRWFSANDASHWLRVAGVAGKGKGKVRTSVMHGA